MKSSSSQSVIAIRHLFYLVVSICLFIYGCNKQATDAIFDQAFHPDTLLATVDTVHIQFSNLGANNYFGIQAGGSSGKNKIVLHLGTGAKGSYKWSGSHYFMDVSPHALWNDYNALKDSGGLTILEHVQYSYIKGTFEFTVVDSTKDTIHIRDGYFRLHYTSSD